MCQNLISYIFSESYKSRLGGPRPQVRTAGVPQGSEVREIQPTRAVVSGTNMQTTASFNIHRNQFSASCQQPISTQIQTAHGRGIFKMVRQQIKSAIRILPTPKVLCTLLPKRWTGTVNFHNNFLKATT